jgi:hypothetical protein
MKARQILAAANLQSISALKDSPSEHLIHLVLSGHYLAGFAAKELSNRLCNN